jgi:hypothetical protein
MSPYPNEHSCRLRDPGDFEPNSFRRIKSGKASIIIGRLKGKTTTTDQAIRYPKDAFDEATARAHCKDHGGSFEAAAAGAQEMEVKDMDYLDPKDNPMIKTEEE